MVNWVVPISQMYVAPKELTCNFLPHSYKDFAPTEHVILCDLRALLFNSKVWPLQRTLLQSSRFHPCAV
jgi:hypothetical protein